MLAKDVVLYGDGGGKAPARREPLRGMSETARFLASFSPRADREGWSLTLVDVTASQAQSSAPATGPPWRWYPSMS